MMDMRLRNLVCNLRNWTHLNKGGGERQLLAIQTRETHSFNRYFLDEVMSGSGFEMIQFGGKVWVWLR